MDNPLISVIIVSYNGLKFLRDCLSSVLLQSYKNLEIIVVDNGSTDGSVEFLRSLNEKIIIVESQANLGFAEGNNIGLERASGEYITLLNNDTVVNEDWLTELYEGLIESGGIAAGPKIVFMYPFVRIKVKCETFNPSVLGISPDTRDLGVMINSNISFKNCSYPKKYFRDNCFGEESIDGSEYRWLSDNAIIDLPFNFDEESLTQELLINIRSNEHIAGKSISIHIDDNQIGSLTIDKTGTYSVNVDTILLNQKGFDIVNNVGSEYDEKTGTGRDLGFEEIDKGQFENVTKRVALCGCSFIVAKSFLDKIGLFDKGFFAYYEDTDFFWRLRKNFGDKIYYIPTSVVRHYHTGTSTEWSPFFIFHVERNRILMLLNNSTISNALLNIVAYVRLTFLSILRRDVNSKIRLSAAKSLIYQIPKRVLRRVF